MGFVVSGLHSFLLTPEAYWFVYPETANVQGKFCPLSVLESRGSKQSIEICSGREELKEPTTLTL
jgi:hypothetical protein